VKPPQKAPTPKVEQRTSSRVANKQEATKEVKHKVSETKEDKFVAAKPVPKTEEPKASVRTSSRN
jgi:hypothetical protein